MTSKRFTETAEVLNKRLKQFGGSQSRRKAALVVANRLGLSADAVDSWRRGTRCIPEEKIVPLVKALGFVDKQDDLTPDGEDLVAELLAAREQVEIKRTWQERVEEGGITLEVREADYLGAGRFWSRIVYPFLDAACIAHAPGQEEDRKLNFQQLQAKVWAGNVHLALGILYTPRLSLKLSFFNSPVTYRLNGVILKAAVDRLHGPQRVRDLLARRVSRARYRLTNEIRASRTFHPVVMRGEVGEAYVLRNLKITDVIETESLDPAAYCDALLAKPRRQDGRVRMAVADEITCLSILRHLHGRGRLVFPLVPDGRDRRGLIPPSFALGIATSRNERLPEVKSGALQVLVTEALAQHIYGNARSIAFSYVALRNRIRQLVDQAVPEVPVAVRDEWTARTFRLGDALESWRLEPPHWRAVLREAMLLAQPADPSLAPPPAESGQRSFQKTAQDGLM
jgi:hypothetical protein